MKEIRFHLASALLLGTSALACGQLMGKNNSQAPASDTAAQTESSDAAAKDAAEEVVEAPAPTPEPNPALRDSLSCSSVAVGDVQIGKRAKYEYSQGMAKKSMDGFIDRRSAEVSDGCFLGDVAPGECAVFTVDHKSYYDLGNSNEWETQCVYSDAPEAGLITNKDVYPYKMTGWVQNKDMILKCGNNQGDDVACDDGSNAMRGGMWQKKLDAEKKDMLSFCNHPVRSSDPDDSSNRYVFCQYYNTRSKTALVGFEYLRAEVPE